MAHFLKTNDRIYISGPISRDPEAARRRFAQVERYLSWNGYRNVINPEQVFRSIAKFTSHASLIHGCAALIADADVVLLMHDWKKSVGACMEAGMAITLGKPLLVLTAEGTIEKSDY